MILAAGLLVLLGLGLFVAGLATGTTLLYWATVAVCAAAAVLLLVSRRGASAAGEDERPAAPRTTPPDDRSAPPPSRTAPAGPRTAPDLRAAPPESWTSPPSGPRTTPPRHAGPADTGPQRAVPPLPPLPPVTRDLPPVPHDLPAATGAAAPGEDLPPGRPAEPDPLERPPGWLRAQGSEVSGRDVYARLRSPDPADQPTTGSSAAVSPNAPSGDGRGEPPIEDVEVTDLLLVMDLRDEVFVIDEHPRYHLAGCARLTGRTAIPLPIDEARTDGFTPCSACAPDRNLAARERARRSER